MTGKTTELEEFMATEKLTQLNFKDKILNSDRVSLVDFYADWCGPCKIVSPIVDELAEEYPNITVGKLNVDQNPELVATYNIMSIPTLIIFKNGKEFARTVGYTSKQDLELYLLLSS